MNAEKTSKNMDVFDWTDDTKLHPSTKVVLNYTGGLRIKFNENVQKTVSKNGYLLAGPFPQEKDSVHLLINDRQYYISKIYVLAKEVVIQHEPFTNGTPVSVRIPIVSASPQNTKFTCIDRLLTSTPLVSFQLNSLLKEGSLAAIYDGGTVLYLQRGISIQTVIPTKNAVNPFDEMGISLFEPDYTLVNIHLGDDTGKKEGFSNPMYKIKEGMDDMEDDLECTPFDIGADNVQFMQVPIADETISGQTNKNTMYGILYMFYMGIIVMVLAFLTPLIVKSTISNVLKDGEKNSDVMTNFKSMFVLFFMSVFLASVFITLDGSQRNNVDESKAGLIIFFLAFSCSSIFVVYTTVSGVLRENTGKKWDIGKVTEFLFECLPLKKYSSIFYISAVIFIIFYLVIIFNEKVLKGPFYSSPYLVSWGIFMSFTLGILFAYLKGYINLNQPLGNNPNFTRPPK